MSGAGRAQRAALLPIAEWVFSYRPEWLRSDLVAGLITGQKMRPLLEQAQPRVVALDLSAVFDLEYTALKMFTDAEQRSRERGVDLWLVGMNPAVLEVVQRSPLGERLGRERMHFNLEAAVAAYRT